MERKKYSEKKSEERKSDEGDFRKLELTEEIPYHRTISPEKYLCCGGER